MKSPKIIIALFITLVSINLNCLHAQSDHDQHDSTSNNPEIIKMLKTMQEDIKQLQKSLQKDYVINIIYPQQNLEFLKILKKLIYFLINQSSQ